MDWLDLCLVSSPAPAAQPKEEGEVHRPAPEVALAEAMAQGRILCLMGSKIPAYALRKTGLLNRLRVQNSWLREWDTVIDWPASTAFSDGYPDVPLLEPAGTPVAVFPDERLLQHARDCNWRIMLPGS